MVVTLDGNKIISGSSDETIKVWDLYRGEELQTLSGHSDSVYSVVVTPDGNQIISGSRDKTIKVWDLQTGKELRTLTGHSDWVYSVVVTPDGNKIISGSRDKTRPSKFGIYTQEKSYEPSLVIVTGFTQW